MDNPDFILFTDGSYSYSNSQEPHGKSQAVYTAVSPVSLIENDPFPNVSCAQQAELIVLTKVC